MPTTPWEALSATSADAGPSTPWEALSNHTNVVSKALNRTPFMLPQGYAAIDPFNKVQQSEAAQGISPFTSKDQMAAKNGVDIFTGAPYGLRNMVDLASDPKDKLQAINSYFGRKGIHPPEGVPGMARIGPDTGEPEYYNPETQRYTTVDSRKQNSNGLATLPSIPNAVEGGAVTAAAMLGGPGVIAPALMGGLATSAAETVKYGLNALLGNDSTAKDTPTMTIKGQPVHVDVSALGSNVLESAKTTGSGLLFGGVASIPRAAKFFRYGPTLFDEPVFHGDYWGEIAKGLQEAQGDLQDFYKLAGENKVVLDVAQQSQHEAAQMAMGTGLGLKANQVDYNLRAKDNQTSLQRTFQKVIDAYTGSAEGAPMESGQNITNFAAEQKSAAAARSQLAQQAAIDNAKQTVDGLPKMNDAEINQRVTEQLNLKEQAQKQDLDQAWGDLNVKLGVHPYDAYQQDASLYAHPVDSTMNFQWLPENLSLMKEYLARAKTIGKVDTDIKGAKLRAIPDGFLINAEPTPGTDITEADKALMESIGLEPPEPSDGESGGLKISEKPKPMWAVISAIKGLRAGVRQDMARAKGAIPPDIQDTARVAQILADNAKANMAEQDPTALAAWETAETKTQAYGDRWRQGVLAEAAKKKDGFNTPVQSNAVYNTLFDSGINDNPAGVQALNDISDGDPSFQDSIRQSIFSIYRNHYTKNGVPDPKLHAKFTNDMKHPMDAFFGPDDMSAVDRLGTLGDAVASTSAEVKAFEKTWKESPYGDIPANSTMLAKAAFSNADSVQGIGSFLRNHNPELLAQLQKDTAIQLASQVLGTEGKGFNRKVLNDALDTVKGRQIQDIMGPEFMANLKTIRNVAFHVQNTVAGDVKADDPLIYRIIKLYTGAFGREARTVHVLKGWRQKGAQNLLYNILSDPDKMRQFMSKAQAQGEQATAGSVLGTMGASILSPDFDDHQPSQ